ncbi:hypothetical protein Tco_0325391, partial [Tanacetum coccineum]
MAPTRRNGAFGDDANSNIAVIIAQQLQNSIPHIVREVTNNVNNVNANGNGNGAYGGNNRGCTYKEFLACKPRDFDGKEGAIALTRCIKKIKSVMDISGCVNNQKVRYAASLLIYLKSKEDHEVHLKIVLELLRKEQLYAQFSKCE